MLICKFPRQPPEIYLFKSQAFDLFNFLIILLISPSDTAEKLTVLIPDAGFRSYFKRDLIRIKHIKILMQTQFCLNRQTWDNFAKLMNLKLNLFQKC